LRGISEYRIRPEGAASTLTCALPSGFTQVYEVMYENKISNLFQQDESWVSVEQGFTFAWAVVFLSQGDLQVVIVG
jgi:hypothetical protein